ncbi:MAG: hypothetical protein KGN84_01625, partial [Acidobacteriota bacterium]|nr:hypothetical protein [Acidobacteriota bacterium]
ILRLEPLFDRLDKIETALEAAEVQRERKEQPIRTALTRRVEDAEGELQSLRARIGETERRATGAIEALEARLGIIGHEIPTLVETKVSERLSDLEARIEAHVEARVGDRIGALEKTLAEQSVSIGALRDRAVETDSNLQRLIAAIEKLCERTSPTPAPATVLPFEAHLAEAAERQPEAAKRHPEEKKSRFSVTRIFATIAMIVVPFLSR